MSPGARNSRIFALENMLATSSSTLVSIASQLSEAEERERAFSGRGRWSQVRTVAEAKTIMNNLFNLTSSSRCQLWDKEVDCREKEAEIRSLKEKVVNLIRQVEMQKAELIHQEKLKKLYMSKSYKNDGGEGHMYDLRPKGLRNSIAYTGSENIDDDMDIVESEHSDLDETDIEWLHSDDFQDEMGRRRKQTAKKRNSKVVMETDTNTEPHKTSSTEAEPTNTIPKSLSDICCSCSKSSSCKTSKCECRAINGSCSISCSCNPKKCSNRETVTVEDSVFQPPVANLSDGAEIERKTGELASHGVMLLQAALSDKPAEIKNADGANRRPLSDIGNKVVKSNAPKPRKTWRKSVAIQLVPVSSSETEETDVPKTKQETEGLKKQETSTTIEPTKLRLPRAIRSANNNSSTLRDRNSEPSTINKEPDNVAPRHHMRPTTSEKENHEL